MYVNINREYYFKLFLIHLYIIIIIELIITTQNEQLLFNIFFVTHLKIHIYIYILFNIYNVFF